MPPSDNHHNTESDAYVERVSDLFVRVMQKALTDDLMEELAKGQVTSSLLAAMWHVDQHGTCSVRSVAEGMAVTFSAASQLVDRLVKRGLANREESKADRRLCEVSLTPDGQRIVSTVRNARAKRIASAGARMDPDQRQRLVEGLEGFIRSIAPDEESRGRICLVCGREHISGCVIEG